MKKLLDSYLNQNGVNRSDVARKAGINVTSIKRSADPWPDGRDREANDVNPRVMFAIAETLKKNPGRVFDELVEMEMENDMTTDETKLLLINVLDEADATALVTIEDMGDGAEAIVAEIDLPSGDTVRFAVNKANDPITKYDVLTDLSYAMDDYDHEEDGVLFPSQPVEGADRPLVDAEFMSVSKEDADYLSDLSSKIFKARK